jgi:GTP cyclohydrolase I
MKNIEKDIKLGNKVSIYLKKLKIENPIISDLNSDKIRNGASIILEGLGLSLEDNSIIKTPERIARFFVNELFYGLSYKNFPKITFNHNDYGYNEPVICRDISFTSTCEHHFVTINGSAFVSYIPKDRVIGLSKINRIVDFFAKRPQVQERATLQIFHALCYILDTENIGLIIKAQHNCITMRGVNDSNVDNITYKLGGVFLNELKQDFIQFCKINF